MSEEKKYHLKTNFPLSIVFNQALLVALINYQSFIGCMTMLEEKTNLQERGNCQGSNATVNICDQIFKIQVAGGNRHGLCHSNFVQGAHSSKPQCRAW